jgi:dUTP pyrophosphatase
MARVGLKVQYADKNVPRLGHAYHGDAGLDICAAVDVTLAPLERALIPTGLRLAIPAGYAGYVQPRSGRAIREGLGLVNTPGLIDSNYRGELQVIAINLDGERPIEIKRGERIAQLVILEVPEVVVEEVEELDDTVRGEGGFGSSGL